MSPLTAHQERHALLDRDYKKVSLQLNSLRQYVKHLKEREEQCQQGQQQATDKLQQVEAELEECRGREKMQKVQLNNTIFEQELRIMELGKELEHALSMNKELE